MSRNRLPFRIHVRRGRQIPREGNASGLRGELTASRAVNSPRTRFGGHFGDVATSEAGAAEPTDRQPPGASDQPQRSQRTAAARSPPQGRQPPATAHFARVHRGSQAKFRALKSLRTTLTNPNPLPLTPRALNRWQTTPLKGVDEFKILDDSFHTVNHLVVRWMIGGRI